MELSFTTMLLWGLVLFAAILFLYMIFGGSINSLLDQILSILKIFR